MEIREKLGSWFGFSAVPGSSDGSRVSSTAQLVNGEVFEDDMIDINERGTVSQPSHIERYRALIDSFDEERESLMEKGVRWLFLLLAYVLPVIVAYAMGKEIGDAYGGPFSWSDGWSLGMRTVAMAGEFALAMVPAVDIAALLFLAVMSYRSLKKFVADQRVRAQAIQDINEAELEIERAQSAAARRQTEERQDLSMKEQRSQVWLELDRLHAQSMIADAKRRALPVGATSVTPDLDASQEVKIRRIERGS